MTSTRTARMQNLSRSQLRTDVALFTWNVLVSAALAMAACNTFLGRARPTQATLAWALTYVAIFCATLVWLTFFSARLNSLQRGDPGRLLRTAIVVEGPLLALSSAESLLIYLSDGVNHYFDSFLYPAPFVVLLLAVLATIIAQGAILRLGGTGARDRALQALSASRSWVLPICLLLLGFIQGTSYLWVIGNDFTRYWAVADAISSWSGYPATTHLPIYIAAGMYPYSIELPLFPLLLLLSFTLFGHNTLAAHIPALLANTSIPLLIYALYRGAGLERTLAFAAAGVLATIPFLRLYTLNAPVPDAIFVAMLTATGCQFLRLTGGSWGKTERNASPIAHRSRPWISFGLLAGLAVLTRSEGFIFVGMMFLGLLPYLRETRAYQAGIVFVMTIAPYSLVMMSTFGFPWTRTAGRSFGLQNMEGNLQWLQRHSLRWYAEGTGLSPSDLLLLLKLLVAAFVVATIWLAWRKWQWALLPVATGLHIAAVFTVDPRASGADQWFDFFRHISYGIPLAALPLFLLADRLFKSLSSSLRRLPIPLSTAGNLRLSATHVLALLILAILAYHLLLLAFPSRSYGRGARQLLTSDVWVGFPSIVTHRYELPRLPFVRQDGVLLIDPDFEYVPQHLDRVRYFFDPVSSLRTGKGTGYQVSSMLVLLFGLISALAEAARTRPAQDEDRVRAGPAWVPRAARGDP